MHRKNIPSQTQEHHECPATGLRHVSYTGKLCLSSLGLSRIRWSKITRFFIVTQPYKPKGWTKVLAGSHFLNCSWEETFLSPWLPESGQSLEFLSYTQTLLTSYMAVFPIIFLVCPFSPFMKSPVVLN